MDEQSEVVDVELTPADSKKRPTAALVALGGAALCAVLLLGAYFATGDDDTPVDVTAADEVVDETDEAVESPTTTEAPSDEESRDTDTVSESSVTTVGPMDFATDAADSAFYGGGPSNVIFDGTQFVAIGWDENGSTLRTSADGVTWDVRSFPGLPQDSNVYHLAEHDGTIVVVVEQWPEIDESELSEDSIEYYFGPTESPTYSLASSTDLENWTVTELPVADQTDEPVYSSVMAVAFGDSGVVILTQQHDEGNNEMRLLFDAGILNEDNIDRFCGMNFDDGAATVFSVQLCDFEAEEAFWIEFEEAMEAAETVEERDEIEARFDSPEAIEPEVIATVAPGDPLYDELYDIYFNGGEAPTTTSISGPVAGPFVSTPLTQSGYTSSVVEVDGTFVALVQDWGEGPEGGPSNSVISSFDGVTWAVVGSLPTDYVDRIAVAGSNLVTVGNTGDGSATSFVSTDLGSTWSETGITSDLYGSYAQTADGPAGVAMLVQGSTEPYPEFEPPEDITITRDGFTLTMSFTEDGTNTLIGPDGAVIYSFSQEELYGDSDGNIEGVVRTSRLNGNPTFLDPETGEDMVTFTDEDFEEAYGFEDEIIEEDFQQGSEFWFSSDGTSWSPITDPRLVVDSPQSNVQLVAVGDDEVIFIKSTWVEPPAELFAFEEEDREPTEDEIAAIDAFYGPTGQDESVEYIRVEVG